jgi:hypothetical protein
VLDAALKLKTFFRVHQHGVGAPSANFSRGTALQDAAAMAPEPKKTLAAHRDNT